MIWIPSLIYKVPSGLSIMNNSKYVDDKPIWTRSFSIIWSYIIILFCFKFAHGMIFKIVCLEISETVIIIKVNPSETASGIM